MRLSSTIRQHPLLMWGLAIMILLILFGPVMSNFVDVQGVKLGSGMPEVPPSAEYPLGTDTYGREILPVMVGGAEQTMALSNHLFVLITQIPGVADEHKYATALLLLAAVIVGQDAHVRRE